MNNKANATLFCALLIGLAGCSDPRDTPLPTDIGKMEAIQPQLKKLTDEERSLVIAYMMRRSMSGIFGGDKAAPPEQITIGAAIATQRKFRDDALAQEAAAKALREKLAKEREAAFKVMNDTILVTLARKEIRSKIGYSGIELGKQIENTVGFQNKGTKDISGVKGRLVVLDMFGSEVGAIAFAHDDPIPAGQTTTQKYVKSINQFMPGDNKLANIEEGKYTTRFEPEMIVFADGTKLSAPQN